MIFPEGLALKSLHCGPYTTPTGRIASGRVGFGFDKPMLHTPTGDVITGAIDWYRLNNDGWQEIMVPVTVNEDLRTIPEGMINQRLRLIFDIAGYRRFEYYVDIHHNDPAIIDADTLIPYTSTGSIAVVRATVSSVAGLVGDVSAQDLATELDPFFAGGSSTQSVIFTGIASQPLSGHAAVVRQPDGEFVYASADNINHAHLPVWITTGAASQGQAATTVAMGEMTEPSWNWQPGAVFLGFNGALTQNPIFDGSYLFSAVIGYATSPQTLFVNRQPSIIL